MSSNHIAGKTNTRADYLRRQPDDKKLSPEPGSVPGDLNQTQFHAQSGSVCEQTQQAGEEVLFVAGGCTSQGNAWEQNCALSRNWLNPPWEVISRALRKLKEDKGSAICCLPVWRTAPSLVVQSPKYDDHRSRNQRQCATIPESKGRKHVCPSLRNPIRSATGLTRS